MDHKKIELYERRIDNCWQAAEFCADGTWGREYWTKNAMYLLRRLNCFLNGGTEK